MLKALLKDQRAWTWQEPSEPPRVRGTVAAATSLSRSEAELLTLALPPLPPDERNLFCIWTGGLEN